MLPWQLVLFFSFLNSRGMGGFSPLPFSPFLKGDQIENWHLQIIGNAHKQEPDHMTLLANLSVFTVTFLFKDSVTGCLILKAEIPTHLGPTFSPLTLDLFALTSCILKP